MAPEFAFFHHRRHFIAPLKTFKITPNALRLGISRVEYLGTFIYGSSHFSHGVSGCVNKYFRDWFWIDILPCKIIKHRTLSDSVGWGNTTYTARGVDLLAHPYIVLDTVIRYTFKTFIWQQKKPPWLTTAVRSKSSPSYWYSSRIPDGPSLTGLRRIVQEIWWYIIFQDPRAHLLSSQEVWNGRPICSRSGHQNTQIASHVE